MAKDLWGGVGQGHWGPSLAKDLTIGCREVFRLTFMSRGIEHAVDSDVEVTDDDLICQVESVAVCDGSHSSSVLG